MDFRIENASVFPGPKEKAAPEVDNRGAAQIGLTATERYSNYCKTFHRHQALAVVTRRSFSLNAQHVNSRGPGLQAYLIRKAEYLLPKPVHSDFTVALFNFDSDGFAAEQLGCYKRGA